MLISPISGQKIFDLQSFHLQFSDIVEMRHEQKGKMNKHIYKLMIWSNNAWNESGT